jgi:hypothetical protein
MGDDPIIKQDETSLSGNFGADNPQVNTGHHSGSTGQPIPIQGQNPAQQTPRMAASHEQAPNTMGDYTSRIVKDKGDYFSHDNKGYYRKDGKTYLITDAPEGDVVLDGDQTAKLDQARADKVAELKKPSYKIGVLPLDYTQHPDYISSLDNVKEVQRFTLDGKEYFRHGGTLYQSQNSIPNVGRRLSPDEEGKVVSERARRNADFPVISVESPIEAGATAIATSGVSLVNGASIARSLGTGAAAFVRRSAFGVGKNAMSEDK